MTSLTRMVVPRATTTYTVAKVNGCSASWGSVTVAVTPPPVPVVTAVRMATGIRVSWQVPAGANVDTYVVERCGNGCANNSGAEIAVTANQWLDDVPPPGSTYVYRVRARKLDAESARSAPAFATLVTIADYPAVAGATLVRGTSVGQMRAAVDALRIAAGLAPGVYTDTAAAGSPVRAVQFQELRDALDPARELLGYPRVSFTDPLLATGTTPIRAVHFNEIVTAVQAQVLP